VGPRSAASTCRPWPGGLTATDPLAAWLERKSQRRSLSAFPAIAGRALRLVWRAARWRFVAASLLELLGAALLGAQLYAVKLAIDAILAAEGGTVVLSELLPPLLGVGAVTALMAFVVAVSTQLQRLVSELVLRATWVQVLDVTSPRST
jgi:ATP-binding cassette, subfamily B, bacterial